MTRRPRARRGVVLVVGVVLALLALLSRTARAQTRVAAPQAATAPERLFVSVITMGPGHEMFERFGHISIRIADRVTGSDISYNWGTFDFDEPGFFYRFLTGDTKYWLDGVPTTVVVDYYRRSGRAVWEQELALTPTEAEELRQLVETNARPENKFYRYDYFLDNCSTRVRDAIDRVLKGGLKPAVEGKGHGMSFRNETLRLSKDFPLINYAMDVALGHPADAVMTAWEEMFVPMRLRDLIRDAEVTHTDGTRSKLVRAERTLVEDARYADTPVVPSYLLAALAVGFGLGVIILALSRGGMTRGMLGVIAVTQLVAGLAGTLLLIAGTATKHVFMGENLNVLLGTPVSLLLAVGALYVIKWPTAKALQHTDAMARFVLLSTLLAVLLSVLVPSLKQSNLAVLALAAPVHLAMRVAISKLRRSAAT